MEISKRIKKQKEDIHFVVCAMGKMYEWSVVSSLDEVKKAKKKYISSYEKYIDCMDACLGEHETFGVQILERLPLDNEAPKYFSFTTKLCLMMAYYYELLVEEITGQKADESKFVYGKDIEIARREYHRDVMEMLLNEEKRRI